MLERRAYSETFYPRLHFGWSELKLQSLAKDEGAKRVFVLNDTEARSLLQVKIKEVDEADDIFTKLMGDEVEPRRKFIEDNALNVRNLDV